MRRDQGCVVLAASGSHMTSVFLLWRRNLNHGRYNTLRLVCNVVILTQGLPSRSRTEPIQRHALPKDKKLQMNDGHFPSTWLPQQPSTEEHQVTRDWILTL